MSKFISLMKYEAKTIIRDPINLYMSVFPLIILAMASFVFPMIIESIDPADQATKQIIMLLLLIITVAIGSYFLAAMATFLLIENKDECTLNTIAVTPIGMSGYVKFKMTYIYVMTVISNIVILLGTKLIAGDKYAIGGISLFDNIGLIEIIAFSIVSSLFIPSLALLQGSLAKNKVEGFAYIKGTGIIALIPAIMILEGLQGGMQYLLGVFPNFWAIKGIMLQLLPMSNRANLSFPLYLLIGAIYNIVLLFFAYRMFKNKVQY